MSARVVRGDAAINAWEQAHADALGRLRHADAFILIEWPALDADATIVAVAKDGGSEYMQLMLARGAAGLVEAYEENEAA